jgi:hypothetical protein
LPISFGKDFIENEKEKKYQVHYNVQVDWPIIEGLSGTGYAARQIKGELIPVHDGGRFLPYIKSPRYDYRECFLSR